VLVVDDVAMDKTGLDLCSDYHERDQRAKALG
jgi:hypothetical protein